MNGGAPHVSLGELLRQVEDVVDVRADQQYPNIGIYSFGRGVFPKPPISGSTSSANRLYRARAGQFVYSRLFAFEGAYGLVPDELDGAFVSNEFPLLEPVSPRLRIGYMAWYFRLARIWAEVATKATGMGSRRQRIHPEMIFAHAIPLPSPDEQDRIVATLDAAAARVAEARRLCREIDEEADALCRSILSDPRHSTTPTPMRELVTPRPADVDVKAAESYHFAGIYCFGKGMFRGQTRLGAEFSYDTVSRVRAGDFTYPKLMAWEGALCVVPPECDGLYVSTEYPVFEINTDRVLPDVLDVYFRSPEVWPKLSGTSKGTNVRRRRLNPQQFLNYVMPLPKRDVQERVAAVRAKLAGIKAQHAGLVTELEALMPAILDRAFKGELGTADLPAAASALSAIAAPMIAGSIDPHAYSSSTSTDVAPLSDDTGTAQGNAGAVKAHVGGGATVQAWNIPEIAAIQAELVRRNGGSPTLGRKKISKGAYLAAALLGAKQNPPPLRKAAGPFNTQGQNEVEAYATQAGWFRDSGSPSGPRSSSRYRAGDRISEAAAKAKGLVAARAAEFERFMGLFVTWDSDTAELHATAHAAWNILIAAGKPVTEAAIIETFFEWSEEKAKFKATQIRSGLATLRSLGMEPNGGGPVVAGVGESNLFGRG